METIINNIHNIVIRQLKKKKQEYKQKQKEIDKERLNINKNKTNISGIMVICDYCNYCCNLTCTATEKEIQKKSLCAIASDYRNYKLSDYHNNKIKHKAINNYINKHKRNKQK